MSKRKERESREKYIDYAESMLRANYMTPSIYEGLIAMRKSEGKRSMTEISMSVIVSDALKRLRAEYSKERGDVIVLHVARYNKTIDYLRSIDIFLDQDSEKYIERKTRYLHLLLDTLYAKEKILGIHKKSFRLEINNELDIERERVKNNDVLKTLNLDLLTFEEQVELLELINKTKVGDSELMGVIEVDRSEEKTVDIDHEEIKDQPANIEKVKHIKSSSLPTEVKATEEQKSLFDVQMKLRQSFMKKAKETIQKKGGHLDDKEKQI